eukprot:g24275.t1
MFGPLGCMVLRRNMRCCFSSFLRGVIVALEDGRVIQGVGGGVKVVCDQKVLLIIAYRAQMIHESVTKCTLGHTNAEETTSGATDTVDQVGGWTGEPLSDLESLSWASNGGVGA